MIIVDSSVWIAHLRGQATPAALRLRAVVEDEDDRILVGDLVLLEVLQGARDEAHAARIERNLRTYPIAPMLDETIAVQAARNYRLLRVGHHSPQDNRHDYRHVLPRQRPCSAA